MIKKLFHLIISFDDTNNEIEVEIAMQFTQSYQENIISFVNLVRTGPMMMNVDWYRESS